MWEEKIWKMWVIADSSGKWATNAMEYNSKEEAEEAGRELSTRWLLVRSWMAAPLDTDPNEPETISQPG